MLYLYIVNMLSKTKSTLYSHIIFVTPERVSAYCIFEANLSSYGIVSCYTEAFDRLRAL